ncbi:MAG: rhomboid family intramembrane serine protease [Phycisphaerales bacterium]
MGIYDREYVRVGPRSQSGLGSLGGVSVNTWIIVATIAVFVLDAFLAGYASPVWINDVHVAPNADPRYVTGAPQVHDALGKVYLPPAYPGLVHSSAPLYQPLIDSRTGEAIGLAQVSIMTPFQKWGHFSTALGFFRLELWRFLTFQVLHANITHLLFNMFGLWVFGGMVEQYLGGKRYLAFYLTCGIFGAVSYLVLNFLGNAAPAALPALLPNSVYTPLIGASAGVFGVIMACAFIAPNARVMLLFPPIPLKLKWMAYGYVILAAWNLLRGGVNAGGDAAHIGGAIAGAFFIRHAHLLRDFFDVFGPRRGGGRGRRGDVASTEVDRILSKVARDGLRSLSEEERRVLQQASSRMRR